MAKAFKQNNNNYAIAYYRFSSHAQNEASIDQQREQAVLYAEKHGYGVVREMVGHGVGKNLHEDPQIPNYGTAGMGPKIPANCTLAIEPMINMGAKQVVFERDGWTVRTKDRKPSAHFEHCIAIRPEGPRILSSFDFLEEVLTKN